MLGRSNGVRNASSSASTLHSSDLETGMKKQKLDFFLFVFLLESFNALV